MAIQVTVKKGAGDIEAQPISDPLILNDNMAMLRGKRFLNDPAQGAYYHVTNRPFKVTHKSSSIAPTSWVSVTDHALGLSGTMLRVKNYKITITKDSVWANMDTQQFMEPS